MELLKRASLRIVHAEDDCEFARLTEIVLKVAGFEHPITHCQDGLLALHYFSSVAPETAPHVILLDLHMPHMNGLEVLHWVRHNYREKQVAVYLLTSSDEEADRKQARADRVTGYIIKSPLFTHLVQKLDRLIATTNQRLKRKARKRPGKKPNSSAILKKLSLESTAI